MSRISDIYDTIVSRLETLYPSHTKLTNPHKPEENNQKAMIQGYGLRFGVAENTNRCIGGKLSIQREVTVIFTRKIYAKEQDLPPKQTTEKTIFEDQYLMIKDAETYPDLEDTDIAKFVFTNDSGLEYIFTNKDNFIKLETSFLMEYFENLN